MKTAFVAYRHTGESPEVLEPMLSGVCSALKEIGIEAYCTFFSEEEFQSKSLSPRRIMEYAFETIEKKDLLFVVMANSDKSEGMIMEVGRFFGRMPIIVAKHESVEGTYIPEMADVCYEWTTNQGLVEGIPAGIAALDSRPENGLLKEAK